MKTEDLKKMIKDVVSAELKLYFADLKKFIKQSGRENLHDIERPVVKAGVKKSVNPSLSSIYKNEFLEEEINENMLYDDPLAIIGNIQNTGNEDLGMSPAPAYTPPKDIKEILNRDYSEVLKRGMKKRDEY